MTLEAIIAALVAMSFQLPVDRARIHVEAAVAAAAEHDFATLGVDDPVTLLLGVAYVESRFDERALSRIECTPDDPEDCTRKTGVWPRATKPANVKPRTSIYCGPMQTGGYITWIECQKMRTDVAYGYSAGAKELVTWLNDKRCSKLGNDDRLRCALAGHNGGNAALANAATYKYVDWVFIARNRLIKFATFAQNKALKPQI